MFVIFIIQYHYDWIVLSVTRSGSITSNMADPKGICASRNLLSAAPLREQLDLCTRPEHRLRIALGEDTHALQQDFYVVEHAPRSLWRGGYSLVAHLCAACVDSGYLGLLLDCTSLHSPKLGASLHAM